MEDEPNSNPSQPESLPTQPPAPLHDQPPEQSSQPAPAQPDEPGQPEMPSMSSGPVYVGMGPGGTAKAMPSRKRLLMIAGAATVLVVATGVYGFAYYLPNRPANVFKSALTNTADGYDQLVSYAGDAKTAKAFNNTQVDGTFKVSSSSFSTDGSFSDHSDQNNSSFTGDVGLSTTRLKIDGIVKKASNSSSPDVYFRLGGIKGLGGQLGMPQLDTLDNQWVSVDHTFFDNILKQTQGASGQNTSPSVNLTAPSEQDVTAAAKVLGDESHKYLFSTDSSTAVFTMQSFVGKETTDGKSTDHYKVSANKDHLKTFIDELGKSLDKTKLNDWAKTNYGKSLSDLLDVQGMTKSADNIKNGDTFDMWVNTKTKLVHKVRINDKTDPANNYIEFGLNYDGGAEKPVFLNAHTKQDGVTSTANFGLNINTDTNVVKANLNTSNDDGSGSGATTATINVTFKPATGTVDVTAPTGTITLSQALDRLGLTDYVNALTQNLGQGLGSGNATLQGSGNDQFTITQ